MPPEAVGVLEAKLDYLIKSHDELKEDLRGTKHECVSRGLACVVLKQNVESLLQARQEGKNIKNSIFLQVLPWGIAVVVAAFSWWHSMAPHVK
jgi:hypothetical protein